MVSSHLLHRAKLAGMYCGWVEDSFGNHNHEAIVESFIVASNQWNCPLLAESKGWARVVLTTTDFTTRGR